MKCTAVVVKRGATFSIILEYLANHIENWCHFDTISSNVSALGEKMPVIWTHSPEKFSFEHLSTDMTPFYFLWGRPIKN